MSFFSYYNYCVIDGARILFFTAVVESSTESYIGKWTAIESNTFIESIKIVDNDTTSYKYCNQNMLNWDTPFVFPALPSFQPSEGRWMTGEQESLAQIWAWTSVAILAFVFTFFLISIKHFLSAPFQVSFYLK